MANLRLPNSPATLANSLVSTNVVLLSNRLITAPSAFTSFRSGTVNLKLTVSNTNPVYSSVLLAPQLHLVSLSKSPYLMRSLLTTSLALMASPLSTKHMKPSSMWMNTMMPCCLQRSMGDFITLVSTLAASFRPNGSMR